MTLTPYQQGEISAVAKAITMKLAELSRYHDVPVVIEGLRICCASFLNGGEILEKKSVRKSILGESKNKSARLKIPRIAPPRTNKERTTKCNLKKNKKSLRRRS